MRKHHRQLDASVGASGPHGFAVRKPCHSSFDIARVHRIPSRVRDDREPPLWWDETARFMQVIWVGSEGRIFLAKGLDTDLLICPSGKLGSNRRDKNGIRLTAAMRRKCVGWVEHFCETHHMRRSNRWVSLRSTHPTRYVSIAVASNR